jgi:hypothetical protein
MLDINLILNELGEACKARLIEGKPVKFDADAQRSIEIIQQLIEFSNGKQ